MRDVEHRHRALRVVGELGRAVIEQDLVLVVHDVPGAVPRARQRGRLAVGGVAVARRHQVVVTAAVRRRGDDGRGDRRVDARRVRFGQRHRSSDAALQDLLEVSPQLVPGDLQSFLARSVF